jgi:hypothetical protein
LGILDFTALFGTMVRKRRDLWNKAGVKESNVRRWFVESKGIF